MALITLERARSEPVEQGRLSALMFSRGSLQLRFYAPKGADPQTPHTRDEVYVMAGGHACLVSGDERYEVTQGDVLFVAAGVEHRFEELSADFSTWVVFYGPEGG